jgi:protein-S-isoprenylcysteine O-methyltransferase Ste14
MKVVIIKIGTFLYRFRDILPIPLFLLLLYCSRPRPLLSAVGAVIIVLGLALRFWAAGYLGRAGRNFDASRLVTTGPYRYFRHPLYFGNFLLVIGALAILHAGWRLTSLTLVLFIFEYSAIAMAEEHHLARVLGEPYLHYRGSVSPFLPLSRYRPSDGKTFSRQRARSEMSTVVVLLVLFALVVARIIWLR